MIQWDPVCRWRSMWCAMQWNPAVRQPKLWTSPTNDRTILSRLLSIQNSICYCGVPWLQMIRWAPCSFDMLLQFNALKQIKSFQPYCRFYDMELFYLLRILPIFLFPIQTGIHTEPAMIKNVSGKSTILFARNHDMIVVIMWWL